MARLGTKFPMKVGTTSGARGLDLEAFWLSGVHGLLLKCYFDARGGIASKPGQCTLGIGIPLIVNGTDGTLNMCPFGHVLMTSDWSEKRLTTPGATTPGTVSPETVIPEVIPEVVA